MKDKTILELIDKLVLASNRANQFENETYRLKEKEAQLYEKLSAAEAKIAKLEKEVESNTGTINYWAEKAVKYENELAELKEAADDET